MDVVRSESLRFFCSMVSLKEKAGASTFTFNFSCGTRRRVDPTFFVFVAIFFFFLVAAAAVFFFTAAAVFFSVFFFFFFLAVAVAALFRDVLVLLVVAASAVVVVGVEGLLLGLLPKPVAAAATSSPDIWLTFLEDEEERVRTRRWGSLIR